MKKYFLILSSSLFLMTCTREQIGSRPYPRVATNSVSAITSVGAVFNAEITYTPSPMSDHGFVWSMNKTPTIDNSDALSLGALASTGAFSSTVTRGLLSGVQYYVRGYARTPDYLVYGDVVSFMSLGSDSPNSISNVHPFQHLMPHSKVAVLGNFGETFQVKLNGQPVAVNSVTNITKGQFILQLPGVTQESNTLSIVISGKEIQARQKLSVALSYRGTPRPRGADYYKSICVVGKKSYFGLGTDSLFTYDPTSNTFIFLGKETIPNRTLGFSFAINGVGYFGGGSNSGGRLNDFYALDTATNSLTRLADLGDNTTVATFVVNNKGYRINYQTSYPFPRNELYEFDPITNGWTKKTDVPGTRVSGGNPASFGLNGVGYFGPLAEYGWDGSYDEGRIDLWRYDPTSDHWTKAPAVNVMVDYYFGIVGANNTVYLVNSLTNEVDGTSTNCFEFVPSTEKFQPSTFVTNIPLRSSGSFSIDGVGFVLSGTSMWKFDPKL